MKKFLPLLAGILLLCGCSPRIAGNLPTIPEQHPDYAVIYFFRPGGFVQTPYDVHLGDAVVFRSKNKNKAIVKVEKPGTYEIWGQTETREGITLDIQPGKDYYIRTTTQFGVAVWRPQIDVVPAKAGKAAWNALR